MTIKIKHKRGTASAVASANPTPAAGELVFETDTRRFKLGDGSTAYSSLSYVTPYVTATDRLLGRSSAGAGSVEEITCTSFGRSLISSADAAAARTTLSVQPTASPAFTGTASFGVSVSVGTSTPTFVNANYSGVHIHAATATSLRLTNATTGQTATDGFELLQDSGGGAYVWNRESTDLLFGTAATTRLTISSTGTATFAGQIVGQAGAAISGGAVTVTSPLRLTGTVAGNNRMLEWQTSGTTRWQVSAHFNAESGSNAGSDLHFTRWSDAGVFLGTPLQIRRDNGIVTVESGFTAQGQVLVTSGSGSAGSYAPGIAISGDPDTGIQQMSGLTNTLSVVTAGNERLRVGSGGRFTFFANSEKYGIQLNNGATANGPFIGSDGADIFTISTAGGAERLRVDASGNVGIGTQTVSTGFMLDVRGAALFYRTASDGLVTAQGLQTASGGTGKSAIQIDVNGQGGFAWQCDATSSKLLRLINNNGYGAGESTLMAVSSGGNFGIGTTTTTQRLNVVGTSSLYQSSNGTPALGSKNFYPLTIENFSAGYGLGIGGVNASTGGTYIQCQSFGSSVSYPIYMQALGGEVLIGTTTDNGAYLLQVNSQIYATNATIATSDARFKTNVESLTDATSVIESLRPVAFDFIPQEDRNFATERQVGLIAQEAQAALAGIDYADSVVARCGDHLGLAYEKLVPVLIKALQESNARIAALEERLNG